MDSIDTVSVPTVYDLNKGAGRNVDEKTALRTFDAYFLGEMLRRSAPKSTTGILDGGQAGQMYQDQFYQELARLIAEKGDFGLAGSLKGHLSGTEEGAEEKIPDDSKEEGS